VQFTHFLFGGFIMCKFTICYEGGFDSRLTNVFLFSAYSFPTTKHTVCKSMGEYALLVHLIVQRTRQFVESVFLVVFFSLLAFFYASFSCILRVLISMYFRALNYWTLFFVLCILLRHMGFLGIVSFLRTVLRPLFLLYRIGLQAVFYGLWRPLWVISYSSLPLVYSGVSRLVVYMPFLLYYAAKSLLFVSSSPDFICPLSLYIGSGLSTAYDSIVFMSLLTSITTPFL